MIVNVWNLLLGNVDARSVKLAHAHAAVSRLLDQQHWQRAKPWSIGMLQEEQPGVASLRVTTIGDEATDRLLAQAFPGQTLQLGRQQAQVLFEPARVFSKSEEDVRAIRPGRRITVVVRAPTTFRTGNKTTPLADPARLLNSMTHRWLDVFGSPFLPKETFAAEKQNILANSRVTDIDGKNRVFTIGKQVTVSGFEGTMTYEFDSVLAAQSFSSLFGLVLLTGLGSYTTRGLGVIDLDAEE